MEREPSPDRRPVGAAGLDPLAGRAGVRLVRPSGPSRSRRSRELRLRARIDGLLEQRAAKERRILALEDALREQLRRNVQLRADLREARDG